MNKINFIVCLLLLNFSAFSQTTHFNTNETEDKIEVEIANSDYELVTTSQKELVSRKFRAEIEASNAFYPIEENKVLKNGVFFDALLGLRILDIRGQEQDPFTGEYSIEKSIYSKAYFGFGVRIGNKWYFREGKKYRPGFQVIWLRVDLLAAGQEIAGNRNFGFNLSPLNVGFVNAISNGKTGIEANLNFGINTTQAKYPDFYYSGVLINPVIKFRYKYLAAGIDIAYMGTTNYIKDRDPQNVYVNTKGKFVSFGLTFGVKF